MSEHELIRRDMVMSILKSPRTIEQMIAMVEGLPNVIQVPKIETAAWVGIDDVPHEDYECNMCGKMVFGTRNVFKDYPHCPGCGRIMV